MLVVGYRQVPRLTVGVVWGPGPVVGVLHQDRDHSGQVCGRGVVVGIAYSGSQDSRCKIWNLNLQKSQTCLPICCRLQCCQEGEGWLKGGGAFLQRARMSMVDLQHPCCRGLEWVSSFQKLPGWIAPGGWRRRRSAAKMIPKGQFSRQARQDSWTALLRNHCPSYFDSKPFQTKTDNLNIWKGGSMERVLDAPEVFESEKEGGKDNLFRASRALGSSGRRPRRP